MPNYFLLVEDGAPNDCRAAFVGCFDDELISIFEINEGSPFFFGEVGEFDDTIRFKFMNIMAAFFDEIVY